MSLSLEIRKKIMLEMLKSILHYCEVHNLKIFLAGGTLLGAVRHKGYIPWDDDIDLMMPMPDYNKLIELQKSNPISLPYKISDLSNNSNHIWPFVKMIDTRTILTEPVVTRRLQKSQKEFYGVYIDIFPMYGIPNDINERIDFQKQLCDLYEKLKKSCRVMNRRKNDSNIEYILRCILYFIYCIPNKVMGYKYYLKKIKLLLNNKPFDKAEYLGWTCGITKGEKDHIVASYINNVQSLEFENLYCPVISNYSEQLTKQYGDYMKLPKDSERHIHPSNVEWRKGGNME